MQQVPINILQLFLKSLPQSDLCFAYGSAVQPQSNYDYTKHKPMIDLIIGVDNVEEWHAHNLKLNPKHYSGLSYYLGSRFIQRMNVEIFPIHFSPFVEFHDQRLKYGIVSSRELTKDLESWKWLSLAGRMQKPILTIQDFENQRYKNAYTSNLQSAIAVALLMDFKEETSLQELLYTLMSLSYHGDIRFALGGENSNKVMNILKGNYKSIAELYLNNLGELSKIIQIKKDGEVLIDTSTQSLQQLCTMIPGQLLSIVLGEKDNMRTLQMMSVERIQELIKESVKRKNKFSSQRMLMYNIAMISPLLSMQYGFQKLSKRFK